MALQLRGEMNPASGYQFNRFVLNLERGCLQEDGTDLELRPKSFEVLRRLVEQPGRLLSKDELVKAVWPNVFVNDHALAQCIRDIRKVLGDEGELFIRTVPRRGYIFVAKTAPIGERESLSQPTDAAEPFVRRWTLAVATGVSLGLVLIAAAAWSGGWFAETPSARDGRLTIAVLPFANVGETPGQEWLGEGIAEDIITAVSRFRELTVIARNSSFRYRGDIDPRQIGRELNADFLLLGSVRRSGEELRTFVQLVDAQNGASRWSERYDRLFADVFAVQDEIANSVATQLVLHAQEIAAIRLQGRAPENLEAYELVLRGRKAYLTFTRSSAAEAQALAERAIALDPNYAAAWELLAVARLQFYIQPYSEHQGTPAMLQQAREAAERAVSLDANFATAQATLAFVLLWSKEHDASLEAVRRAIALNPSYAGANAVNGNIMTFVGDYRKAIEAWEREERLNPFGAALSLALRAVPHILLKEFESALHLTRTCAQRAPRVFPCYLYLAIAAKELGLEEEARDAGRQLLVVYPKFTIEGFMRILPYRSEAEAIRLADYMRRAGLPE
jgi:adenylate cyclase